MVNSIPIKPFPIYVLTVMLLLASTVTMPGRADSDNLMDDSQQVPVAWRHAMGRTLTGVEIHGLWRTQESVVLRELQIEIGQPITFPLLGESLRRLKNLLIFSKVTPEFVTSDAGVVLHLYLQEKWTIIPFFTFTQAGGIRYFATGMYDINLFGLYQEVGVRYENWQGEHGGSIWWRDRRWLQDTNTLAGQIAGENLPRSIYTSDNRLSADYTTYVERLKLHLDREYNRYLYVAAGLELKSTRIRHAQIYEGLTPSLQTQLTDISNDRFLTTMLQVRWGRINDDNYLQQGLSSYLQYDYTRYLDDERTVNKWIWNNEGRWRLPAYANLAARCTLASVDSDDLQHLFFVGGVGNIRGFNYGQFHGRNFWQANLEYRLPSLRNDWLVIQHVAFADVVKVEDQLERLFNAEGETPFSLGLGVRFISPRVYRMNLRIDYALMLNAGGNKRLAIAAQQFF